MGPHHNCGGDCEHGDPQFQVDAKEADNPVVRVNDLNRMLTAKFGFDLVLSKLRLFVNAQSYPCIQCLVDFLSTIQDGGKILRISPRFSNLMTQPVCSESGLLYICHKRFNLATKSFLYGC